MKKGLLFLVLLALLHVHTSYAQTNLFSVQDTACVKQKIRVTNNVSGATSYYWNFCSGYLGTNPVGVNIGTKPEFIDPKDIQVTKDGDNFYGFLVNQSKNELLRLSYGENLSNIPAVENLGSINGTVPVSTNALYVIQEAGEWFLFACGGTDENNSSIARFNFGTSLANAPTGVNFGNDSKILHNPRGIFVAKDGVNLTGFVVNHEKNELIRLSMGTIFSNTPLLDNMGNVAMLNGPTDIAAVKTYDRWYLLITNQYDHTLSRIAFDFSLRNAPQNYTFNLGTINNSLNEPTAITVVKDCDYYYGFVVNRGNNTLTRINIANIDGGFNGFFTGNVLGNLGQMNAPVGMSRVVREMDSLYIFSINSTNRTITRHKFGTCSNAAAPSSLDQSPDAFSYSSPGVYTVFLAVDEGLPTMQTECHTIRVLPIPPIALAPLDTTICERDTVRLYAFSSGARRYAWSPAYNLKDTLGSNVYAYPDFNRTYRINISYPNGCAVDTAIRVKVVKVDADAGPDRVVTDGEMTVLGGPLTTEQGNGREFRYTWVPGIFLDDPTAANPTARPFYNATYRLEVVELTSGLGCKAYDTVTVFTECGDLALPNAFMPASDNYQNKQFGIINKQIARLNVFAIYNRWGIEVFTTKDPTKSWDGKINGIDAPSGVYVWQVDGFCSSGKRITKSGNVTLIR